VSGLLEKESVQPQPNQEKIRHLKEKIRGIDQQLQMVKDTIQKEHPDYYALKYPQPVDLDFLQKSVLAPHEIILVYNVMQDTSCMWAVGKDHFSMTRIDKGSRYFTDSVTAFRDQDINVFKGQTLRAISRGGNTPESAPSAKTVSDAPLLYRTLFPESIAPVLAACSTIYIVPTGPLYLLPFEALKNNSHQYLIETHSFAYLSSASLLHILRAAAQKTEPAYPFLAFANPVYEVPRQSEDAVDDLQVRSFYSLMRGNIEALPETEDEVTRIKNILKAPEASNPLQTQKNASRSTVFDFNTNGSLDDYRYISFACHGIIPDETNGITQPSLLLSTPDPRTREIGLLTMSDAFGLTLNADLVALSACNTGRGEVVNGEGVMGLTRAFMYAGTPAVSVNLWSVETISAQQLSVSFFQTLQQGAGRADALRASKLKLLHGEAGNQFRPPFFWAPTVLFGDGS
ncbi:MAG: CHAT domain-containing protein, partial [Desulfosalsimonadaceae bacterium]|nr:CHAT domain-containing protein [Desulfosalsimonadaceae bacterium]